MSSEAVQALASESRRGFGSLLALRFLAEGVGGRPPLVPARKRALSRPPMPILGSGCPSAEAGSSLTTSVARSAASGNGCRLALPEDRAESLTNPSGFPSASACTSLGNPTRVQGTIRPGSSRRESEASLLGSPRAPAYPAPPFPVSVRTLPKGLGHESSSPEQAQS